MNPLEAAIRAACAFMGADPDTWQGFRELGERAADAFVSALPEGLAEAVRRHISEHQP